MIRVSSAVSTHWLLHIHPTGQLKGRFKRTKEEFSIQNLRKDKFIQWALPCETSRKGIVPASIWGRQGIEKGNTKNYFSDHIFFEADPAWRLYCIAPSLLSPRQTLARKYLRDEWNPNPRPFPILYILLIKELHK